ncbi:lysosomal Pro-X carboxypeptidase-like isoform X2 [Onthophagus taurus]|uniref:lysosomal Pro-X carboxypeptidase-like isoform X2 n=1 Tax=Onthophagus taurus TaxID=166361 RepID=UPI0039BEC41B
MSTSSFSLIRYTVLVIIAIIYGIYRSSNANYTYDTKYITVPVDHFSFAFNHTFRLRFLINELHWKPGGPIFFYTGNEGNIEEFAQNVGLMWEMAPEFNAVIVFAEHRYYGKSLPFGKKSHTNHNFGYLTTSQALADFVNLLADLKEKCKTKNHNKPCKAIAFGGSYGGMLAAWIRLKYPASVDGAIAASAPIYQFNGLTECNRFNDILVKAFRISAGETCMRNIKRTWNVIRNYTSSSRGQTILKLKLHLCKLVKNKEDLAQLLYWLNEMFANLTMLNYPYPCNGLPENPVKTFCESTNLTDPNLTDKKLLNAYGTAIRIYANSTSETHCIDIHDIMNNPNDRAWYYQSCTELVMPMCIKDNEMFEKSSWNFTNFSEYCYKHYGFKTYRQDLPILEYGGKDAEYNNVVFTNELNILTIQNPFVWLEKELEIMYDLG